MSMADCPVVPTMLCQHPPPPVHCQLTELLLHLAAPQLSSEVGNVGFHLQEEAIQVCRRAGGQGKLGAFSRPLSQPPPPIWQLSSRYAPAGRMLVVRTVAKLLPSRNQRVEKSHPAGQGLE